MAAPQVAQSQVAQQLDRRLGVAAVQGRAVEVILIEQTDVAQEGELAVLEQVAAAVASPRRRMFGWTGSASRSSAARRSSSGSMTRSARNWASWSRRRDFRLLVWVANWASTTRSQKSADWLAILRNHAPRSQKTRQMTPRMMTGQPIKVWTLSTTPRNGFRKDRALTIRKRKRKTEPEPEQPLGGRARGVDERGAQAVEEDRRRQRAVQVGEEVDDVEPALNQVAQIVGGERHGFGRALLAVGDQVANDRQAPDQREVEQPEIAVDGPHERRPRPVDEPFGRHLDQALDDRLDRDLATVSLVGRFVDRRSRQGARSGLPGRRGPARRAAGAGRDRAGPRSRFCACSSSLRSVTRRWRSLDSAFWACNGSNKTMLRLSSPAMRRTRRSLSLSRMSGTRASRRIGRATRTNRRATRAEPDQRPERTRSAGPRPSAAFSSCPSAI